MARLEGLEGAARFAHARAGHARSSRGRRGSTRSGLALCALGLVAVNWAGWACYGAGQGSAARAARPAPLSITHVLPTRDVTAADRLTSGGV